MILSVSLIELLGGGRSEFAGDWMPGTGATMASVRRVQTKPVPGEEIGDFELARALRRTATLELTMSERLARLHTLCKQMSAIKGAASNVAPEVR